MKLNARCMQCMIDVQAARLAGMENEEKKAAYFREVLKAVAECPADSTAPVMVRGSGQNVYGYFRIGSGLFGN